MKKIVLTLLLTVSSLFANNIEVKISNISNKTGQISIGLYNKNDDTFTSMTKYYKAVNLDINDTNISYVFKNIPKGVYAISVVHDENKNNILDTNLFGIPNEGYGFSNNIIPSFRAATFEESKFEIQTNKEIFIKLAY